MTIIASYFTESQKDLVAQDGSKLEPSQNFSIIYAILNLKQTRNYIYLARRQGL